MHVALAPETEHARRIAMRLRTEEARRRAGAWRREAARLHDVRATTPARIDSFHGWGSPREGWQLASATELLMERAEEMREARERLLARHQAVMRATRDATHGIGMHGMAHGHAHAR